MADHQVIGKTGVLTLGPLTKGGLGEVTISIRGGSETFTAVTHSDKSISQGSVVMIVDHFIPRTVLVEPF